MIRPVNESSSAPQADRLDLVRRVVESVIAGHTGTEQIAAHAQVAPRYALYSLHAARGLGLIDDDVAEPRATNLGTQLAKTGRGSAKERDLLRTAFEQSAALGYLAALSLTSSPPSAEQIADRIVEVEHLSVSTALRRARTVLCWRRYLVPLSEQPGQLTIAFGDEVDIPLPESPSVPEPSDSEFTVVPVTGGDTVTAPETPALPDNVEAIPEIEPPISPIEVRSEDRLRESDQDQEIISQSDLGYLRRHVEQGTVVLFTGAGFSLGAQDGTGQRLPTGPAYARELWELCYPGEPYDSSSLQDIFEHAHRRHPRELSRSLSLRFAVDSASLPEWYRSWFAFPWLRAYTVNVDDLDLAAPRRFDLPRRVHSISALAQTRAQGGPDLEVIHLNGCAADGPDKVTFSIDQYSQRIARQEPFYAQLAAEIMTRPFVFVGSPLEEPLLWSHIALRGARSPDSEGELRAKSFLVTPELSRARRDKLRAYNVIWVKATAEVFASTVLVPLEPAADEGRRRIAAVRTSSIAEEKSIVEVSVAVQEPSRKTEFLLGEEPTWSDLTSGRAVPRDEDQAPLAELLSVALSPRKPGSLPTIFAFAGTAGAGKTTLLMRAALHLNAAGVRVAWVSGLAEVAPSTLTRHFRNGDRPSVLVLDDAGRFGSELVPTMTSLAKSDRLSLVVLGLRSYHQQLLQVPGADQLNVKSHTIGPLTNGDIDRLLEILEREKRLGFLRSLNVDQRREVFRARAARQILVAMIEATSGERFDDKVVREWLSQEPVGQYVYALVSLATAYGYHLAKDEVLLSCGGGTRELESLERLKRAHLIVEETGQYQARHRVIAEKLVDELTQRGTQLERLVVGLCRALAIKDDSVRDRGARPHRVLKRLLNHNTLLRLLSEIEPARAVYAALEEHSNYDYHFWLQRGCLELEAGDVRHAENFLQQAAALNSGDALVRTAMAHMQLRKAISNPAAPESGPAVEVAFEALRGLIAARGAKDSYPAHVFGSQALAWSRRAAMTPRARNELLREARDVVVQAVGFHRSRKELRQLEHDLRAALLAPS